MSGFDSLLAKAICSFVNLGGHGIHPRSDEDARKNLRPRWTRLSGQDHGGLRCQNAARTNRRESDDRFASTRLGNEVNSSRNDFQGLLAEKLGESLPVKVDDAMVGTADDQECWRLHFDECVPGKIRPPAARHHGRHPVLDQHAGKERGGCTGACSEESQQLR